MQQLAVSESNYLEQPENMLFWLRLSAAQHPVLSCPVVDTLVKLCVMLWQQAKQIQGIHVQFWELELHENEKLPKENTTP